jgi:hypothetical protein
MALPAGHRFEATHALRQVLARAVAWGLLETNPAKGGVDKPATQAARDAAPAAGRSP